MPAATVAGVYAQALLALAEERGSTMQVIEDCRETVDGLTPALITQLNDPRLGKAKAKDAIRGAFTGKLSKEVIDLLQLLIDRNRLGDAPIIFAEAIRAAEAKVGLVRVQAVTAHPITAVELTTLTERLKKALGPGVMVQTSTDPSLISGLTLRFGDTMLDASARRLLGEMKATILSAPVGANLWSE
ncbi:MAG: ATP synthase F1 subunit delta [Planctomycetes bacterium]|nr:ATP synthase F1 subunit delta [Planctomycetota bacterium]